MKKKYLEIAERASKVVPSEVQLKWQDVEYYACVSFGMNTFTNSEWGSGNVSPDMFNPTKLNVRQWAKVVQLSGMKAIILTVKHYDGFCLWPSEYTDYSVKNSPWCNGNGDLVKEVANACRELKLKFGIYLSTWDMHEMTYGKGDLYNAFFKNQLRELLTNYGDIFCVRLDDTCGESESGHNQEYDWQGYYNIIRELQPDAAISICGPDVRWCGNDRGFCRKSEWSVVPAENFRQGRHAVAQKKNKSADNIMALDLGSLKAISYADELIWYPAEVALPLRKKWFYHEDDDYSVKPLSRIIATYFQSVGANASFMLNLSPNQEGVLHERDVETLLSVGAQLKIEFNENLAEDSILTASCALDEAHCGQMALTDNPEEYWHSGNNPDKPELVLDLGDDYDIDKIVLKEHIRTGQQIEEFTLYAELDGKWKEIYNGTVIGHKRICRFKEKRVRRFKLVIEDTRVFATLSSFEAY